MAYIVDEISRKEKHLCPFPAGPVNLAGKVGIPEIGADVGVRHLGRLIAFKDRRKALHIHIQMFHLLPVIAAYGAIDTNNRRSADGSQREHPAPLPELL